VRDFPTEFLWGSSTSAHQVEGDNVANDWSAWETESGSLVVEPAGLAIDHYRRYDDDFALLASLGQNAHRFSLEWSRIEPEPGAFSEPALQHYADVLASLHGHGLTPVVTLHHKTVPLWFAERGGWLAPDALEHFARYVDAVVHRLGAAMSYVCTINEPQIIAVFGHLTGQFPPALRDEAAADRVNRVLMRAHRLAVALCREHAPETLVGTCLQLVPLSPMRPDDAADAAATALLRRLMVDDHLEDLRSGGDVGDWVGVQYYTRAAVDSRLPGLIAPAGPEVESTQMGWEVYPEGFGEMLRAAASTGLPVLVTENGVATSDDGQRLRYLQSHLGELLAALQDGVDVRGYLHWSAFDNFEWNHGYAPTFGLIGIDRENGLRRVVRPSAVAYGGVASTGRISALEAEVDRAMPRSDSYAEAETG
jgi:beta-glucosidase